MVPQDGRPEEKEGCLKISVCIPFGPGHEQRVLEAVASAEAASVPDGWDLKVLTMDDSKGAYGRSKARNLLADAAIVDGARWLFFVDADDLVEKSCFLHADAAMREFPQLEAIWGRIVRQRAWRTSDKRIIKLEEMRSDDCVTPILTKEQLLELPGHSTLRVGNFVTVELFQKVGGYLEDWDVGEDHEFHYAVAMHARKFAKIDETFVWIRTYLEGAYGPRGYVKGDPRLVQHPHMGEATAEFWRKRGGKPWSQYEKTLREEGLLYE